MRISACLCRSYSSCACCCVDIWASVVSLFWRAATPSPGYESDLFRLSIFDRSAGTSRVLTESFRNWVDAFQWASDSKSLYFDAPVEGDNPIFRVSLDSGSIQRVLLDHAIDSFELSHDNRSILYTRRSVSDPAEIYAVELTDGKSLSPQRLSRFNDEVANEVDIRPAERKWVKGADGANIEVFIVKPHNFDPSKKYPLILNVHGGPQFQWQDSFRGDWQVYPGAGYIVAFANPHGSTGYGQDFGATEELWFPKWDYKGQPWNSDQYEMFSPSYFVKNFKTPCLVISGERDYRVPYTQSLQMFTSLQEMKVPSKLIVYSDAGHWPSWYEMALYYTAHLEWFHQYLAGDAPPWSTEQFLRNGVFDPTTGQRVK
jgi:dipeptidyl aminopeptidase/acylaminoacyl peptidase